jgi:5-methylcytosine-specific restriction endonuclease McrA
VQDDFEQLAQHLIKDLNTPRLNKHRVEKNRIDKYYSPRQRFNRWRDSDEGKAWKQRHYETLKGICPGCSKNFPVNIFEIDHKEPISQSPKLATNPQNMDLLCPPCNRKKSSHA